MLFAGVDGDEGANYEGVVVVFTLHAQGAHIAVNVEGVIVVATEDGGGIADTTAHVSNAIQRLIATVCDRLEDPLACCFRQGVGDGIKPHGVEDDLFCFGITDQADDHGGDFKGVSWLHIRQGVAARAEDLTDLEVVLAFAAIEGGDGAVVVHRNLIITAEAIDAQASVDVFVVVDPLNLAETLALCIKAIQQGNKVLAAEEGVVLLGAIDDQHICAAIGGTVVKHIDQGIARTSQIHRGLVGA